MEKDTINMEIKEYLKTQKIKALYSHQVQMFEKAMAGKIAAGVYDGDTPVNERSRIRKSANKGTSNAGRNPEQRRSYKQGRSKSKSSQVWNWNHSV